MSDYVFLVGDDYESSNKKYVSINTDKGMLISIALAASGIPFKGRFDKERMLFNYDGIFKESVDEIIAKFTSDEYAVQRDEIAEHKGDDCFYFLPVVAKLLRMTEGTLRSFFIFGSKNVHLIGSTDSRTFPSVLNFLIPKNCPCCPYCFLVKHTFPCGIGFHFSCQLRVSAQHFEKLKRSEIVVPAKFGNGAGFLVLSHWFVVLSFEFIFDFSVRIWYNGFGNWSG